MILTLDVGNTQIFGGVFDDSGEDKLVVRFRAATRKGFSSDELGLFLRSVLRENDIDPKAIRQVAVCSVVPHVTRSVVNSCIRYFDNNPFVLKPGVKTGLKIRYRNPNEVGADRIANAIAALKLFPDRNRIIVDLGTANTICAISAEKDYLGGIIFPGLRISVESLGSQTAKLPVVEIEKPAELIGRGTIESIQSGLYHGTLAAIRQMTGDIRKQYFNEEDTVVIGTGGFAGLFDEEKVFDILLPDLVHIGLYEALKMNR